MSTSSPLGDQEISENAEFPPTVVSPEAPGAVIMSGPLQFNPPSQFINGPERIPPYYYLPPQGPPPFSPYQDNGPPLQSQTAIAWQSPQNFTVFGAVSSEQLPYFQEYNPYANPAPQPYAQSFVAVPTHQIFSGQNQVVPAGAAPHYPIPVNTVVALEPIAVTDEMPPEENEDQSRDKGLYRHIVERLLTEKRKAAENPTDHSPRQNIPDHMHRNGRGGSLLCDVCRRGKRGKKVNNPRTT